MDDQTLHHFMEDLMPIVVLPIMSFAMAWVIAVIVGAFKHRANLRAQTSFHNKMLEKFDSAAEFTAYLKSDAGKAFFERLSTEPAAPLTKILSSIQFGTVLTLLGLGLIILGRVFAEPQLDKFFTQLQGGNIMIILGTVSLMIGIGFIISSAISYRLAKSWGLIAAGNKQAVNDSSVAGS